MSESDPRAAVAAKRSRADGGASLTVAGAGEGGDWPIDVARCMTGASLPPSCPRLPYRDARRGPPAADARGGEGDDGLTEVRRAKGGGSSGGAKRETYGAGCTCGDGSDPGGVGAPGEGEERFADAEGEARGIGTGGTVTNAGVYDGLGRRL